MLACYCFIIIAMFTLFTPYPAQLKGMFTLVKFFDTGSRRRELEEQTYIFFGDFLDDIEGI